MPVPPPGSREAQNAGCICPVLDNGYGRGYMDGMTDENGETIYVRVIGCPLHAPVDGYDKDRNAVETDLQNAHNEEEDGE